MSAPCSKESICANDIDRDEVYWDSIREEELCWDSKGFEWAFIWSISVDALAKKKDKMPSLYSSYQKCGNNETKITISLIRDWLADDKISEDEYRIHQRRN